MVIVFVVTTEGAGSSTGAAGPGTLGVRPAVFLVARRIMVTMPRHRTLLHQLHHLTTHAGGEGFVGRLRQHVGDPVRDADGVLDRAAARGHGGGSDADAGGDEGRTLLVGDGVLVHGDPGTTEHPFGILAGQLATREVEQHQVVVGAAGDEDEPPLHQPTGHGVGVVEHRLRVDAEGGHIGLAERHRLASDDVHERTALTAREHGGVVRLRSIVPTGEADATARTTEGLVRGAGHVVARVERAGVEAGRDEPSEVSHVADQDRSDLVGDLPERLEVPQARVGGSTGHEHLGALAHGDLPHLVHVDAAVGADPVGHRAVELARTVRSSTVGEVSTAGQGEAHQGVTGLEGGEVQRQVGVGTGVRLYVHAPARVQTEHVASTQDGELLDAVDVLTATVVALAREALGVLVGEGATHDSEHLRRDVVLGSDELEVVVLTFQLGAQEGVEFRI